MINLMPIEEKKKMTKDFYFRLLVVSFTTFGLSMLLVSLIISPSYFLSLSKKNSANEKLAMQGKEPVPKLDQQTSTTIKDLKNELNLIEKAGANKFKISQGVVSEVLSKKIPGIKINHISYQNDPTKGKEIDVDGLATNRDRLLLFRQTLEVDPAFLKVVLPISNFVKDSNIKFNLTLTPA